MKRRNELLLVVLVLTVILLQTSSFAHAQNVAEVTGTIDIEGSSNDDIANVATSENGPSYYETMVNGNNYRFGQSKLVAIVGTDEVIELSLEKNNIPLQNALIRNRDGHEYFTDSNGKVFLQVNYDHYGLKDYIAYDGETYLGQFVILAANSNQAIIKFIVNDENNVEGYVWNFAVEGNIDQRSTWKLANDIKLTTLILQPGNDTITALNGNFNDDSLFSFYRRIDGNAIEPIGLNNKINTVTINAANEVKINLNYLKGLVDNIELSDTAIIAAPKVKNVTMMDSKWRNKNYMYLSEGDYNVVISGKDNLGLTNYLITDGLNINSTMTSIQVAEDSNNLATVEVLPYDLNLQEDKSIFDYFILRNPNYKLIVQENKIALTKNKLYADILTLNDPKSKNIRYEMYNPLPNYIESDTVYKFGGLLSPEDIKLGGELKSGNRIRLIPQIMDSFGNYLDMYNADGYLQTWSVNITESNQLVFTLNDTFPNRDSRRYWSPAYDGIYLIEYSMDLGTFGSLNHSQKVIIGAKLSDLENMSRHYGLILNHSDYKEEYDLNTDGIIDIFDIVNLARHFQ